MHSIMAWYYRSWQMPLSVTVLLIIVMISVMKPNVHGEA